MNFVISMSQGMKIYLGAPASPAPKELIDDLCGLVSSEEKVIEAHYPQCYIPSAMTRPAQVLFIVVTSVDEIEPTAVSLAKKIDALERPDLEVYVLPLVATDATVSELRRVGCKIYG